MPILEAVGEAVAQTVLEVVCWVVLSPVLFVVCTPVILVRAAVSAATRKERFGYEVANGYSSVWAFWKKRML